MRSPARSDAADVDDLIGRITSSACQVAARGSYPEILQDFSPILQAHRGRIYTEASFNFADWIVSHVSRGAPEEMKTVSLINTAVWVLFVAVCPLGVSGGERDGAPAHALPEILEATKAPGSLIGMQYENWFTPHNATWDTAEAIPMLGKYSSYDPAILRKHFEWFGQLGIDWLLIDWSNMLWSKPAWEAHTGSTYELEQTVAVMFKTALELAKQGKYAPKMVFMLGLQNGPPIPDGMKRLNGIIAWLKINYLSKPEYRNLWLYYDGKPLLTVLYFPSDPCGQLKTDLAASALEASDWTVRWMASQLQYNHAERCGMWSWMDGNVQQVVTNNNGKAEEVVVTPACFQLPSKGWRHPSATGRDHGAPYLESWKIAFESRPKFIQIHQWNEFAGQKENEGMVEDYWQQTGKPPSHKTAIYGDEYNLELSDDLEPTKMQECAYRGCGGWGYYYMNLTKALISLYRGETPDITVLALSGPFGDPVVQENRLPLRWSIVGRTPQSYAVFLDGRSIAQNVQGLEYVVDLSRLSSGRHRVKLRAEGVKTYFDLDGTKLSVKSAKPLPVSSEIEFTYSPR